MRPSQARDPLAAMHTFYFLNKADNEHVLVELFASLGVYMLRRNYPLNFGRLQEISMEGGLFWIYSVEQAQAVVAGERLDIKNRDLCQGYLDLFLRKIRNLFS